MKPLRTALVLTLLTLNAALAGADPATAPAATPHSQPNKTEPRFEMTTYYVGLLYRGPKWTPEVTPETEALQKAHLDNIRRLGETGKLLLAGPFSDDGKLRGMFVFQVGSMEEAKALCDTDPAVQAGRLVVELHPWYSAKGIRIDQTAPGKDAAAEH